MAYVGQTFKTSNSTVATLAKGTTLRVAGNGFVEITGIPVPPKPVYKEGDKVYVVSKGRTARIVRMTDVQGLSDGMPPLASNGEKQQFYVGDAEPTVVRVARESDLHHR